jgi:hypothetical protein
MIVRKCPKNTSCGAEGTTFFLETRNTEAENNKQIKIEKYH